VLWFLLPATHPGRGGITARDRIHSQKTVLKKPTKKTGLTVYV
jgi:hypothetical protein